VLRVLENTTELEYPESFQYKVIPLADLPTEQIIPHLDDAIAFIQTALISGSVLVHCAQGVSRSATIVTAYVMKTKKNNFYGGF